MKKYIAILLAVMMVFLFTACSKDKPESEAEPTEPPATEETTESNDSSETSGIVEVLDDGELTIYTKAKESLTFNVENAKIESADSIQAGDAVTVEYTGKIEDGDTTGCEVTKVVSKPGETAAIDGEVKSLSTYHKQITIVNDGKEYTFDATGVEPDLAKAAEGATVEVKYTGVIENTDTGHAYVKQIVVTKAPEKVTAASKAKVKAVNDKVWTTKKTAVRVDASSDAKKVKKLKKGKKLKRTGILDNGWSRIVYDNKDMYVKTKDLTTKKPKKKQANAEGSQKKTVATETSDESQPASSETKKEKSSSKTVAEEEQQDPSGQSGENGGSQEETNPEEGTNPEEQPSSENETTPEEQPAEEEPATLTDKGVMTDLTSKTLILDGDREYNIKNADYDFSIEEALDKKIKVEYTEGTNNAVKIYLVDSAKGTDGAGGSGSSMPVIIVAVIVVIVVAGALIIRSRRKNS